MRTTVAGIAAAAAVWVMAVPASAQISASSEQLLINQRISQAAIVRADAIERVLARIGPEWVRDGQITRAKLVPEILTNGEGRAESFAPERRNVLPVRPASHGRPGAVRLSAEQLLINQRISQAAVARANALEQLIQGRLTGGNLTDGAVEARHLAEDMLIGLVRSSPTAPPARPAVRSPRRGPGRVVLSAEQLRINQRISQAAIRRLNDVREVLVEGLEAKNFADGTITSQKLALSLRSPPPGLVRENPVPRGQSRDLPGGWALFVVSTDPDGTAEVLAENQFNSPPAPGRQFYLARVRLTRTGSDAAFSSDFSIRAVGPAAVSYSTFQDSCGVIPDPLPSTQVFSGGAVEGNVCWSVRTSDVSGLLMFYDGDPDVFFAL